MKILFSIYARKRSPSPWIKQVFTLQQPEPDRTVVIGHEFHDVGDVDRSIPNGVDRRSIMN